MAATVVLSMTSTTFQVNRFLRPAVGGDGGVGDPRRTWWDWLSYGRVASFVLQLEVRKSPLPSKNGQ